MSQIESLSPRRPGAGWMAGVLLASCVGLPTVRAGESELFLYALNDLGEISLAGTLLESLTGDYDPGDFDDPQGTSRWMTFEVSGSDRWSLRLDGRVEANGDLVGLLPFGLKKFTPIWRRLAVAEGVAYSLRSDGLLGMDGSDIVLLPDAQYLFNDVLVVQPTPEDEPLVFSLRSDGAVFAGTNDEPLYQLKGGKALFSSVDGVTVDTHWLRMDYEPVSGLVYALRSDGKVRSFDPAGPPPPPPPGDEETDPLDGVEVVAFPFKKKPPLRLRDLYVDFAFLDDTFVVVRTDGRIYRADDAENVLVNLPGTGHDVGKRFADIVTSGSSFYALRRDGRVYRDLDGQLLDLPGGRWVQLRLGDAAPDLSSAVLHAPRLARWKARAVVGESLVLPVLTTDADTERDLLDIAVDLSDAPDATWDVDTASLVFTDLGAPGTQRAVVTVDDGETEPVQRIVLLRVLAADDKAVNRRPEVSRPGPVPVTVGAELVLPVLASDRDGDELVITPQDDKGAFLLGAVFDAETSTLVWTPELAHVGRHTARFTVSDGSKQRMLRVRLDVQFPLLP